MAYTINGLISINWFTIIVRKVVSTLQYDVIWYDMKLKLCSFK